MREEGLVWDLVVSVPWLESGGLEAMREFIDELTDALGKDILQSLQVVMMLQNARAFDVILDEASKRSQPFEKTGRDLFGLPVREAYIFKAQRPRVAA